MESKRTVFVILQMRGLRPRAAGPWLAAQGIDVRGTVLVSTPPHPWALSCGFFLENSAAATAHVASFSHDSLMRLKGSRGYRSSLEAPESQLVVCLVVSSRHKPCSSFSGR